MIKITLDDWLAINGCSSIISDWSLDKCKFPHGLLKSEENRLLKEGEKNSEKYYGKRKDLKKLFCQLVEVGKIQPLTSVENDICCCSGNPELESTKAAKRLLWKKTQKLPNSKLRTRIDIRNLYDKFGTELDSCSIDIENVQLIADGKVIYQDGENCLLSSCNDDSLCLFTYDNKGTVSLTYEEMRVSIYGDSLEKAKELADTYRKQ